MCGRFSLTKPAQALEQLFPHLAAQGPDLPPPRYNIAPTQPVLAVRAGPDGTPQLAWLRWGLTFPQAGRTHRRAPLVNLRLDTATQQPLFRELFQKRRCLVLADGFYEWPAGAGSSPYYIHHGGGQAFALAALWAPGAAGGEDSCTLLTTSANALIRPLHERMPVLVPPVCFAAWLAPAAPFPLDLLTSQTPHPADLLRCYPVSAFVNDPRHEGPRCLAPPPPTLFGP